MAKQLLIAVLGRPVNNISQLTLRSKLASRRTSLGGSQHCAADLWPNPSGWKKYAGSGMMQQVSRALTSLLVIFSASQAFAQSAANLTALRGLAPVSALENTPEGKEALAGNLAVTGGIQTGALHLPLLLPFAEQQRLALRDSFITDGNATELADGLGSKLGRIYQSRIAYSAPKAFGSVSQKVTELIAYTNETAKSDSNAGKYFFANATTDGKAPVSQAASDILKSVNGVTDIFGKAYEREAGTTGADAYGNSRPFQTEPALIAFRSSDYFGKQSHSLDWLRGPSQNLTDSPSYPSGHTTYGYTEALILAIMVPERYQQMIGRAAEYGNDRIIMGAHYAMDVLGGRTLALHDVAHLLANHPDYVGKSFKNSNAPNAISQTGAEQVSIGDYRQAFQDARKEVRDFLAAACGGPIADCAGSDGSRFKDAAGVEAMYNATQTYGLPAVHRTNAETPVSVRKVAPEAGNLLTAAFPALSLDEANDILTETLGPGGGFLDDGSPFGIYSRLNLYAAAGRAAAVSAKKQMNHRPRAPRQWPWTRSRSEDLNSTICTRLDLPLQPGRSTGAQEIIHRYAPVHLLLPAIGRRC